MFFSKFIPEHIIANLYTRGSLESKQGGLTISIKNRLLDAVLTSVESVSVDGQPIPLERIFIYDGDQNAFSLMQVSTSNPVSFPLRKALKFHLDVEISRREGYQFDIIFWAKPFGKLHLRFKDVLTEGSAEINQQKRVPRHDEDDYGKAIIAQRLQFAEDFTKASLHHVKAYSFDPATVKGNCENFIGAAQIPIGIAGPIQINGEFARGEFLVPLATTEGTLVASYNRGIKILNLCGGVTTTVAEDLMQRAPVFCFGSARLALQFKTWVEDHFQELQAVAGASSRHARLMRLEAYLSNNFAFLRFNFRTGDAAGQNMVTKATYEGCLWILEHCPYKAERFFLESNMATDKKPSFINSLMGRGKRVTAEITFRKEILERELRVTAQQLDYHRSVANIGAILSGVNNNGLHSVNAITAIFIATGQDVANVAESSACLAHAEVLANGDLHASITLPSLIVGTYGGGTGLSTQRECLELMNCYGEGKAKKLAEIIAGVVAAGEISLAAAISSADWVSSHEALGRNK